MAAVAEKVSRYDSAQLVLQISIDAVEEEVDRKTRIGAERVVTAIDRALKMPVETILASVATAVNIDYIPRIIEHFWPRVKRFHIMDVIPWVDCNSELFKQLLPSPRQVSLLEEKIATLKKTYSDLDIAGWGDTNACAGTKDVKTVIRGTRILGTVKERKYILIPN